MTLTTSTPSAATVMRRRQTRIFSSGIALLVLTALSAGCSTTTSTSEATLREQDHQRRHPILISQEPENLDMPVGMNGPALSPKIETAIRSYVRDYQADGTGSITIQVPTGSANEIAAASTGRAVHYALVRAGVARGHIRVAPYPVDDRAKVAPLRLSYLRVKATVPSCGIWPTGMEADYRNADYNDFGCSQNQNLAAMISNPADLVRPRDMTPAHGGRRAKVLSDYAQGQETKSNIMLIQSGVGG